MLFARFKFIKMCKMIFIENIIFFIGSLEMDLSILFAENFWPRVYASRHLWKLIYTPGSGVGTVAIDAELFNYSV